MNTLESEIFGPFLWLISPLVPQIHSPDYEKTESIPPRGMTRLIRVAPFLITALLLFLRFVYYMVGTFGVPHLSYQWAWVNIQSMEAAIGWLSLMSLYKAGVKRTYFQRYLQLLPQAVETRPLARALTGTIIISILYLSTEIFSIVCQLRTNPWPTTVLGWVRMAVEPSFGIIRRRRAGHPPPLLRRDQGELQTTPIGGRGVGRHNPAINRRTPVESTGEAASGVRPPGQSILPFAEGAHDEPVPIRRLHVRLLHTGIGCYTGARWARHCDVEGELKQLGHSGGHAQVRVCWLHCCA